MSVEPFAYYEEDQSQFPKGRGCLGLVLSWFGVELTNNGAFLGDFDEGVTEEDSEM